MRLRVSLAGAYELGLPGHRGKLEIRLDIRLVLHGHKLLLHAVYQTAISRYYKVLYVALSMNQASERHTLLYSYYGSTSMAT